MFYRLYTLGLNPNLSVFHRPSTYPVARGTPMLSSLVEWDHSTEWSVADFSGRVRLFSFKNAL